MLRDVYERTACDSRCTHGGVCSLRKGHDGIHIALGFGVEECRWEGPGISVAESDALYKRRAPDGGFMWGAMIDESIFEDSDDPT